MNIAIDARMIRQSSMHGIARYVNNLILEFSQITSTHNFFIITNSNSPLKSLTWPKNFQFIEARSRWISFLEQLELPRILKKHHIDLFHSPSFVAPLFCPCKLVMTVHDLNHIVFPEFYTIFHQLYYKTIVSKAIHHSDFLLTVSEFSKNEIIRSMNVPSEKIFVTYNGISSNFKPVSDPWLNAYVREVYELPERYILYLSSNKPHKNVKQLIRAYCSRDFKVPLVLGFNADLDLLSLAESHGKKPNLFFIPYFEEAHLPSIYSMAECFVFPSTYEGFGLPPLEALACGVPVVVTRSSSLPEVIGETGIFADAYNYESIANAMEKALAQKNDPEIIRKGVAHSSNFNWTHMALQTLQIYERCQQIELPVKVSEIRI